MELTKKEAAWIGQAIAVLDHFRSDVVLGILGRTNFHGHLKADPGAVRSILADGRSMQWIRLRTARSVLIAAGLDEGEPMDPVVISWDWKDQPDLGKIAAVAARISGERRPVVMREFDTGGDEHALAIADRDVTDEEALAIWSVR